MRISHNMMAFNTQRMMGINDKKKVGSAEKLSSGYKINRAADDAAGLAISEKMRRLIRGLNQGTQNAQDGISWLQTGEGALNEAHEILHRMTELTVKSLNGTNSDSDRMAMELEFEQLQTELDNIGRNTQFNEQAIFAEHEPQYYQCEGAVKWDPQQTHVVTAGQNKLVIEYSVSENISQTLELTVKPGEYTTQELVDELDSLIKESGQSKMVFEFDKDGYCNVNLEGGEKIHNVSGGLSYLVYDMYKGGSFGALIGTTSFPSENSRLKVVAGQNDSMSFTIEDFNGNSQQKSIQIQAGSYTRSELIDLINAQLDGTPVKATAYGDGIKLGSDEAIVTGFKGNMFKIDGSNPVYNSVFYDNVKYGTVVQEPAYFKGGCGLPTDERDAEHGKYRIDSSNNTLTLQVNDMAAPVTLTIGTGEYTAAEMATELNQLFADAGIQATASRLVTTSGAFEGIMIVSNVKGPDSRIVIDQANSTAYNTLFIDKEYNQYGSKVSPVNENKANSEGKFSASKDLSELESKPLTITSGINDSFTLKLNNVDYTIKMSQGIYDSVEDVVNELDKQLNGADALSGYKGKLAVSAVNNKIVLTGVEGNGVDTVSASNASADVFDAIFQGYNVTTEYPIASNYGPVTLNTPYDGTIDESEKVFTISFNYSTYRVTLPTGTVDQATIEETIENAIKSKDVNMSNYYGFEEDFGSDNNRNFDPGPASGRTTVYYWGDSATGSSEQKEGVVGYVSNKPAVLEIDLELKDKTTVTSDNNKFTVNINGSSKTLVLEDGTYTQESLKNALQEKIDAAFGTTGMNGAVVSVKNNKLVLTARLPEGMDGAETSISCATTNSSFLKELSTVRTAAKWTSTNELASAIQIDDSNREFTFTYSQDGNTQDITLTLDQGTYSGSGIVAELNEQLEKTGTGVKASLSSGKLELKSTAVGNGVSIQYGTTTGGSSAEALFGPLMNPTRAEIFLDHDTLDNIKIETGVSDTFVITVNGTRKSVKLDAGEYDTESFAAMLNSKLSDVEVYAVGKKLGFKTVAAGESASLQFSGYSNDATVRAIYGGYQVTMAGIDVSFDANNQMVLDATSGNAQIEVKSENGAGSAFHKPIITSSEIETQATAGYHSTTKSYIDGVSLSGGLTIDQWNNNLNFTFMDNGVNQDVSVVIPDGDYTQTELQDKLQELLDDRLGENKIKVTVNNSGVRLESVNAGSLYRFSNFGGDFYDKVICSCYEVDTTVTATNTAGKQTVDGVYTVGRKNVRGGVEIKRGISDELTLDLTYGNTVHSISVTLDAGQYTGEELKEHLQEKINAKLTAMNLPENLIEVGIGGINTGVHGANDSSALNFSLSKTVQAPSEGQFIIDGVRGNAAFEIFYQTDGKLEPAYIMGTKDITDGVTVLPGEEDLTIKVDGVEYSITIPEGEYSAQEIRDTLNDLLDDAGAPIVVELNDNRLKISHRRLGEHDIEMVSGPARDEIFFKENGNTNPPATGYIKLSSEFNDQIDLKKHVLSTASLGINSCCISGTKYAEKALERIEQAVEKLSAIRSDFGSIQNRLEHAVNNNENKAENLQHSESVIRDTDMALEMVEMSKQNILSQVSQAMLAQANQSQQGVMALLR